jgi:hypothetical protein
MVPFFILSCLVEAPLDAFNAVGTTNFSGDARVNMYRGKKTKMLTLASMAVMGPRLLWWKSLLSISATLERTWHALVWTAMGQWGVERGAAAGC